MNAFVAYLIVRIGPRVRSMETDPFPDFAGKWQVSVDGGTDPRLSSDRRAELFYLEDTSLRVVLTARPERQSLTGEPQVLFESLRSGPSCRSRV